MWPSREMAMTASGFSLNSNFSKSGFMRSAGAETTPMIFTGKISTYFWIAARFQTVTTPKAHSGVTD
jgi:hypothetical protein